MVFKKKSYKNIPLISHRYPIYNENNVTQNTLKKPSIFSLRIFIILFYIILFFAGTKISDYITGDNIVSDVHAQEKTEQNITENNVENTNTKNDNDIIQTKEQEQRDFFLSSQDKISALSPSEVKILYQLNKRRQELQKREESLLQRTAFIKAAEKALGLRFSELSKLQDNISKLLQRYDDIQINENQKLRQIYSAMKPKDAAKIFNDLEIETLLSIVAGMKPRVVAPIIAAMDTEKVRLLTTQIADNDDIASLRDNFENIVGVNNN